MRLASLGVVALAALALTGCSFSANPVIAASEVETLAASALADQWDAEPTVDCGKQNVALVEGTAVDCVAHNPNSGLDYQATVTITDVDGSKYSIGVTVGDTIGTEDTSDVPTVPGSDLAQLASAALEPKLGYTPVVDCGAAPVAIVLDGTIDCVATDSSGVDFPATITVTEVTETGYDIDVVMGSTPVS